MQKDRVLVRSKVVRAVDANIAKLTAMETFNADGSINTSVPIPNRYIIRAYRFYKKLSAEPIKKTYLPLDKLVSAKRALEIMTDIESPKFNVLKDQFDPSKFTKVGDPAPATTVGEYSPESIKVLEGMDKKVDPTTLPPDHPDHVCTDACYDVVPLNDRTLNAVFIPEWGATVTEVPVDPENKLSPEAFSDTSNVAAGPIAPYVVEKVKEVVASYTFPDKPLVPTKDAVFDDEQCGDEVVTSRGFEVCRWHGWKYIDLRDGRCTALDSGSGYLDKIYSSTFCPEKAQPAPAVVEPQYHDQGNATNHELKDCGPECESRIDLDAAAPVIWDPPSASFTQEHPDGLVQTTSGAAEGWTESGEKSIEGYTEEPKVEEPTSINVYRQPTSNPNAVWFTFAAILGLVYVYFKWFAK